METKETTMLLLVHLDGNECLSTRGGDGTWDKEVVKHVVYRDWETDRKSTRLNSSHITRPRMPSSA